MVEVKISNISITQVGFAILLKTEKDKRVVPIFIGPLETHSISTVLSGNVPPRPMTHDLMMNIFNALNVQLLHVVIRELKDNTFYANIHLKTEDGVMDIDARPSDSIALALRQEIPIYMEESVLEAAGIILPSDEKEEVEPKNEIKKEPKVMEDKAKPAETIRQLPQKAPVNPKEEKIEILKKQLELAVELENYEEAARLRDEIKNLTSEN
jgi:hypothetical protein